MSPFSSYFNRKHDDQNNAITNKTTEIEEELVREDLKMKKPKV